MRYGGLMLLPEGPRTLRECPEGPGTLLQCPAQLVATCLDLSELVATCPNLSQLVGTCLVSCGLKGSTLGPYISKSDAGSLHPSGIVAGPADLARSTAEGVGGSKPMEPWV